MWPSYSSACRNSINLLLEQGGSLSAYRANKDYGAEPKLNSWACRLERQLEMRMGVKYAVAVNSGTAALHCALRALRHEDVSPYGTYPLGEIITSPYTFSATASAIILAGYEPKFADVDSESFCISKATVKRAITRKTKAILPVSIFGHRPDYSDFESFGLPILEDGCQSVGAHKLASQSFACGVSFNGGKNVPAGECGAVLTNDRKVAQKARLFMNHAENFGADYVSYNYRPNELTACVAYHGLLELGENNRQRIHLAEALTEFMRSSSRLMKYIEIPESVKFDGSHVFYVYPFKIKNMSRKIFAARMMKRFNVLVGEGYIRPALHEYRAFRKYAKGHLPVVERLSGENLCLFYDITPGATVDQMKARVDAMVQCVGR